MNLVTSTGTVVGDPTSKDGVVKFSVAARDSYVDSEGQVKSRTLLFFLAYDGNDKAEILPYIKPNARVAWSGFFTGPSFLPNEQYPNSTSINGPTVFYDVEGTPFTALTCVAQTLKVIGPVSKKPADFDDVTTVVLAGVLGRDPELQYTQSGRAVAKNSIAAQRLRFDGEGDERQTYKITVWFRLALWGNGADSAYKWWQKKRGIIVTGSPSVDPTTGAPNLWKSRDGEDRASYDLNVHTWEFAPGKNGNGRAIDDTEYSEPVTTTSDEDIPF